MQSDAVGEYVPFSTPRERLEVFGSHHIWSTTHKYYSCLVPKVGCSSWLHYLRKTHLPRDVLATYRTPSDVYRHRQHDEYGLHFRNFLAAADQARAAEIINSKEYFKWMVVRHPWHRVLSAFRSKYEGQCHFNRTCLLQNFQVPVSLDTSEAVSFHEFVEALAESDPRKMNAHFRPMHLLCQTQHIHYDFVGELANEDDTNLISHRLGFNVTFSEMEAAARNHTRSAKYWNGRTHLVHNCTHQTVALVQSIYAVDALTFGYTFDEAYESCTRFGKSSIPEYHEAEDDNVATNGLSLSPDTDE